MPSSTWSLAWKRSQESRPSSPGPGVVAAFSSFCFFGLTHLLTLQHTSLLYILQVNCSPPSRDSVLELASYQCPSGPKENLPPRGPRAGCIGVRGYRCVRDRRLSVDASLDTRIFTPHLPLVMTSVLSICKL